MSKRALVLGIFALVLAAAAIFYNFAGGDVAEGGGPCCGLAAMIFGGLLIATSLSGKKVFGIGGKSAGKRPPPLPRE